MKIKPNLFLNMSPQTTEEGGLAFARNMKLDDDGNLISDYGYKNITSMASYNIVGHIVGLDDKIYFFCHTLVEGNYVDNIVEYDEVTETATALTTNWTYGGGEIDGYVNTNQSGEKILTIGEYLANGSSIPLKHINLSFATLGDESFYNQAPVCPTANLIITDTYVKTIPNGVYVFFIRYKIRKDVYTNWFLCSRPIFSGNSERTATIQGGLKYINLHKDSAKSFVLNLSFLQDSNDNRNNYKEFQIGFIITHDEATDARAWKHFDMNSFTNGGTIYFDYEDVEEANIDDLLETTYELYNVRNVTSFKNKLYISNYIESNFNINFNNINSLIQLHYDSENISDTNHKDVIFNPFGTPYTAIYNYTKRYYDSGRYNGTISTINAIINSSIYLDNAFGLEIVSNLIKDSSKTYKDILTFKVNWSADSYNTADIAFVNNIVNNILGKVIYGPDFNTSYPASGSDTDHNVFSAYGVYQIDTDGDIGYYEEKQYSEHPWYNLGFTFAFGALTPTDSVAGVKNELYPFNINNKHMLDGYNCWFARDIEFTQYAKNSIPSILEKEIESKGLFILDYIEVLSGTKIKYYNHYSTNNDKDKDNYVGYSSSGSFIAIKNCTGEFSNETINFHLESSIKAAVRTLCTTIQGFDDNGTPIFKVDGNEEIKSNTVKVVLKKFDFELNHSEVKNIDDEYECEFNADLNSTIYYAVLNVRFKDNVLNVSIDDSNVEQYPTLMPYSKYAAYVHFVDNHNIITNGIRLNNIDLSNNDNISNGLKRIYLTYKTDSTLPTVASAYKSFFISLINIGDIVIEGFGWTKVGATNILNCIEVDSLLYNINDNITIKINSNGTVTTITGAKYYSSGDANKALAFGNCGFISWEGSAYDDYSSSKFYIIISRNKTTENTDNLIKASAYIPIAYKSSYSEIPDGYYGSYVCNVTKPDFELSSNSYVSGNDVYSAERGSTIILTEFKNFISIFGSVNYIIRSNFNLNYLSLTEDITDKVFSVGSAASGTKQVAKIINSAILSFIYELKPMYKDFANKFFRRYDSDYKIDFDNTIRVSHVLSDETFNNSVFKFSPEDYYNVPTDRGVIVNLFAIGNNIFVHTKSAFYKFDGNQTIVSNNSDIQLQETEPFTAGISQIFDSEYGYGGIDTKQSGCITFDSYFFYDKSSNHIFAYSGNSQVQLIDGNIYKLLAYYKPSECKTLHDELNCRVLFEFTSSRSEHSAATYKTFTLSYNYKTKTFVSLHDLSLINAFAGRHRAYSYKNNGTINALLRLFEMEQVYIHQETVDEETVTVETAIDVTPLVPSMNVNKIFGNATTACIIEFGAQLYKKQIAPFGMAIVMFPIENFRETVNSIRYIADIQQKDPETQSSPVFDVLVNPQVSRTNPVVNFYIITDCCVSSVVNTNVDDTARPNTLLDYKGFKFDMGAWTSNYFRNDINKTDIYKYGQKYPNRDLDADQNSLVYGRYFIITFDFKADTPVKFEELFMNTKKY